MEEITHFPCRTWVAIYNVTAELVLIHEMGEYCEVVDFGSGFCFNMLELGGENNFQRLGDL